MNRDGETKLCPPPTRPYWRFIRRWLAADRLGRLVQPQRMWKKKMGEATPRKMRKKIPTSRQVLTTTNEITSQKYFLYSKSYLGFLVFCFLVSPSLDCCSCYWGWTQWDVPNQTLLWDFRSCLVLIYIPFHQKKIIYIYNKNINLIVFIKIYYLSYVFCLYDICNYNKHVTIFFLYFGPLSWWNLGSWQKVYFFLILWPSFWVLHAVIIG